MKLISAAAVMVAVQMCAACSLDFFADEPEPMAAYLIHDSRWNGKTFPLVHLCARDGGDAMSPIFKVENIPAGTNVLLVEFNDVANPKLAVGGGLGTLGYYHESGATEALLEPVKGGKVKVKDYAFTEKSHRVKNRPPAGYLPLCLDTRPHMLTATIKAVRRTGTFENSKTEVLAEDYVDVGGLWRK